RSAVEGKAYNTAFLALLLTGQREKCVQLLLQTGRPAEAALFARTYCPSQLSSTVEAWKEALVAESRFKTAQSIAGPVEYPEMFPDLAGGVEIEAWLQEARSRFTAQDSEAYQGLGERDLLAELQSSGG